MRGPLEWLALPTLVSIVLVWCGFTLESRAAVPLLITEHRYFGVSLPMILAGDLLVWMPLGAIAGFLVSKVSSSHRLAKSLLVAAICPFVLVGPLVATPTFVEGVPSNPSAIFSIFGVYVVPLLSG